MVTNTICMVNGIRLQNPSPNAFVTAVGGAPMASAPAATTTTAIATKMKASGNQRSAQLVKRSAKRTSGPSSRRPPARSAAAGPAPAPGTAPPSLPVETAGRATPGTRAPGRCVRGGFFIPRPSPRDAIRRLRAGAAVVGSWATLLVDHSGSRSGSAPIAASWRSSIQRRDRPLSQQLICHEGQPQFSAQALVRQLLPSFLGLAEVTQAHAVQHVRCLGELDVLVVDD